MMGSIDSHILSNTYYAVPLVSERIMRKQLIIDTRSVHHLHTATNICRASYMYSRSIFTHVAYVACMPMQLKATTARQTD